MRGIEQEERQRLGRLLESMSQEKVMAMIPQFSEIEIGNYADAGTASGERAASDPGISSGSRAGALVFNIERGVNLQETIDFLQYSERIRPFDIIFANELDDGMLRSGNRCVAEEIAKALGLNYAWGLEFIELADPKEPKGLHGNAIFSRFPIVWAETFRLPEENNWYFDRQKRIGGRNAIFARLDMGGRMIGAVSIHLENRTDGPGRRRQVRAILNEAERVFPGIPVVMGGDLNTNTFDGRSVPAIQFLSDHVDLLQDQIEHVEEYEPCLQDYLHAGYDWKETSLDRDALGKGIRKLDTTGTRRKPLPNGSNLLLRLDWLLPRGFRVLDSRTVSTLKEDCTFAPEGSALASFDKKELSDHNAVWALLEIEDQTN